ncbi:MAG: hypothetical protein H0U86_17970 [Chloroflexi bacterium]|nr:hypothetical protein [Chloroflexota bacterium]
MRKLIGLIAGVAMVFALALPVAASNHKITICHATSSESNPYVAIKVAANSGYEPHLSDNPGNSPLAGHEQDFLLENTDLETCDQVADPEVTPLAPSVSGATCEAAGMLTLPEVDGIAYTVDPAYSAGDSGEFTVTASAEEGWVIAEGAQTMFEVSVPAAIDCPENAAAIAPSVTGPTCEAPGNLTVNAATGVSYTVSPAYTAGASGTFTITAAAAEGFVLTGESSFIVNVAAKRVCLDGTQGGNPPTPPRGGTLAGVPNTAMEVPASNAVPVGLVLVAAALALAGRRLVFPVAQRR